MTNEQTKEFALALLHADSEAEAIAILKDAGYWDDPSVWRDYGDSESNYSTIGNQQGRPEAAIVEKIINSVDARLMNACLESGIDPTSDCAPRSITNAVNKFFSGTSGSLREWTSTIRRQEAQYITLAATGEKKNPCITIADCGEGQTPSMVPETFFSINKSNKLRIPFVQGKFNMGGTGVLKFCGVNSLHLLITRRNPALVSKDENENFDSSLWSITVTRRQVPEGRVGEIRNSVFKYLAPIESNSNPNHGEILRFECEAFPGMPVFNKPYERLIEFGSIIKLYDYDMKGFRSHILMKSGLLFRLEALMPDIALPVNLHECRAYEGKQEGSFVTTLAGLTVRLEEGKGGNLEEGFPDCIPLTIPFQGENERIDAKIYAFKDGKASTYTTNEGVIFTINGQAQMVFPKALFGRKRVKLGRLRDSLLMVVDCSNLSVRAREALFMNSRDRLSHHELRKVIESDIEDILSRHKGLKEIANHRKQEDIGKRLANNKPLEDVLLPLIKSDPVLAALFKIGPRLGNPFKDSKGSRAGTKNGTGRSGNGGQGPGNTSFQGRKHPTYFRLYEKNDNQILKRTCEMGRRCRIKFETDVENEYFKRVDFPGQSVAEILDSTRSEIVGLTPGNYILLHNGIANWTITIPEEVVVGDTITLQLSVLDYTLSEPFANIVQLTVTEKSDKNGGKSGNRKSGTSGGGGSGPVGIDLPEILEIKKEDWEKYKFDEMSACKIMLESNGSYTFYINIDNKNLLLETKASKQDPAVLKAKFVYGNVLVGLALLQDDQHRNQKGTQGDDSTNGVLPVDELVEQVSRAMSPFLIPMIEYLGAINEEDVVLASQRGDDE